ncbi:MAG: TonB-dependent receptor plug domain-containing protein, partial [Bacteroidota bacterium]
MSSIQRFLRPCLGILLFSLAGAALFSQSAANTSASATAEADTLHQQLPYHLGYGQTTSLMVGTVQRVDETQFNQGLISDPALLLQAKVAGLHVNQASGDPNEFSTLRLRGLAAIEGDIAPLIVVDGVVGASWIHLDPNDIAEVTVLKDAAAAAIYGTRASNGVLLVRTKSSVDTNGKVRLTYQGQVGASTLQNNIPVMNREEFLAAGGTDLGSNTNWQDAIVRTGISQAHHLALTTQAGPAKFRLSVNYREVEGILRTSGFQQFNLQMNTVLTGAQDRLRLRLLANLNNRRSDYGFTEAFHYATIYNPTAPIFGVDAPTPFPSEQYGGYYENLGLFDSFNPVSLLEQNTRQDRQNNYLLSAQLAYQLATRWTLNTQISYQQNNVLERAIYAPTALFRGNAASPTSKGTADFYDGSNRFTLLESYVNYAHQGERSRIAWLMGTSWQQFDRSETASSFGNLGTDVSRLYESFRPANELFLPPTLLQVASMGSQDRRALALFTRGQFSFRSGLFFDVSLRHEQLGIKALSPWVTLPGISAGWKLVRGLAQGQQLLLRVGYG